MNYIGIELPLKKIFKSFLYDELNDNQEKIDKNEDNIGKMFSDNESDSNSNSDDDEESEEEGDSNKKINDNEDDN